MCPKEWFPTQYLSIWIIVVDLSPKMPFCHLFFSLLEPLLCCESFPTTISFSFLFCFVFFFSFGASIIPKGLVSNLIYINMNYYCEPFLQQFRFLLFFGLFCFLFFSFGASFVLWIYFPLNNAIFFCFFVCFFLFLEPPLCQKAWFQFNIYQYELLLWTSSSKNAIFSFVLFSLLKLPLCQRDWFPTQYPLVWIIILDPFLQQFFSSFRASFVPKRLISNSIYISMIFSFGMIRFYHFLSVFFRYDRIVSFFLQQCHFLIFLLVG